MADDDPPLHLSRVNGLNMLLPHSFGKGTARFRHPPHTFVKTPGFISTPTLRSPVSISSRRAAAFAALALAAAPGACKKDGAASDGPLPPGIEALAAGARLEPPVRAENCYASPTRIVFHTQKEWDDFWTDQRRGCTSPALPAGFDWSKQMLVYASMGKRMAAQDRISIDGTGVRNDSLMVFIRRSMLASGCSGREATFPQSLVQLPASTQPIKFNEEHRKIPCDGAS